jgi:hypothetical protein
VQSIFDGRPRYQVEDDLTWFEDNAPIPSERPNSIIPCRGMNDIGIPKSQIRTS